MPGGMNPPMRLRKRRALALAFLLLAAACTTLKRCAYEGFDRESWQRPDEVIAALALRPGATVADLGSGSGYFTLRLARAVGHGGKVFAVDIDAALNRELEERARREGLHNIETILARPDDPALPRTVDLLFTCNTYHHLKDRAAYFARAKRYLAAGARVAIIDFHRGGWIESLGHYTEPALIQREMAAAGYRLEREFDFLPKQSFLVFAPAPSP